MNYLSFFLSFFLLFVQRVNYNTTVGKLIKIFSSRSLSVYLEVIEFIWSNLKK